MSSTLSEGVRVPDIGSTSWGADVNFNWGLLNTCLANISSNVKVDAENTWTAPQTFTETISGSIDGVAARAVNDEDGNNIKTSLASKAADNAVVHLAGAETITGDKTFTGAVVTHNIAPETDNAYSLGSSSYQWSSVYAQTYYYGSTEFSDKFWTADTVQSFTVSKHLKAVNLKVGQGEIYGRTGYSLVWTDKNDVPVGYIDSYKNSNAARTVLRIRAGDYYTNGTPDSEGTQVIATLRVGTLSNSTRVIEAEADAVYPATNNATDLGTSGNKWKTLNGINPGALGMPSTGASRVDIASLITDLTGADINFLPPVPGWLCLRIDGAVGNMLYAQQSSYGIINRVNGDGGDYIYLIFPFQANINVLLKVKGTSGLIARYYPCLGNV